MKIIKMKFQPVILALKISLNSQFFLAIFTQSFQFSFENLKAHQFKIIFLDSSNLFNHCLLYNYRARNLVRCFELIFFQFNRFVRQRLGSTKREHPCIRSFIISLLFSPPVCSMNFNHSSFNLYRIVVDEIKIPCMYSRSTKKDPSFIPMYYLGNRQKN